MAIWTWRFVTTFAHLDVHETMGFSKSRQLQCSTGARTVEHIKKYVVLLLHKSCYEPQTFIMFDYYPRIFCIECIWKELFFSKIDLQINTFHLSILRLFNARTHKGLLIYYGTTPFPFAELVSNKRLDEANFDVKTMKIEKWGWSKKQNKR